MWERTDRQRKGGNVNGADVLRNERGNDKELGTDRNNRQDLGGKQLY